MDTKELETITNSIAEKIGEENNSIIADDIGTLITKNTETQNKITEYENEIAKLKSTNEKLISANGKLLQQIPMEKEMKKEEPKEEKSTFSFRDQFDEKGNFKK